MRFSCVLVNNGVNKTYFIEKAQALFKLKKGELGVNQVSINIFVYYPCARGRVRACVCARACVSVRVCEENPRHCTVGSL